MRTRTPPGRKARETRRPPRALPGPRRLLPLRQTPPSPRTPLPPRWRKPTARRRGRGRGPRTRRKTQGSPASMTRRPRPERGGSGRRSPRTPSSRSCATRSRSRTRRSGGRCAGRSSRTRMASPASTRTATRRISEQGVCKETFLSKLCPHESAAPRVVHGLPHFVFPAPGKPMRGGHPGPLLAHDARHLGRHLDADLSDAGEAREEATTRELLVRGDGRQHLRRGKECQVRYTPRPRQDRRLPDRREDVGVVRLRGSYLHAPCRKWGERAPTGEHAPPAAPRVRLRERALGLRGRI
mmetsp:Transcript_33028/g.105216  ORF Transcript_33028/g.105216 Transcript_33028/m.105216 type:complete len:297 (+) Transcript_33028:1728-2618(+)